MLWRKLLYPFSLPYHLITAVRNWAFTNSILKSREFEVPVIAIGNLSTGGTGKTPMTEFLISHFLHKQIGLVSRGYGRKTKGLILATPEHRFDEIGDEPYQIFHKFPQIKLALAEKRVEGIEALLKNDQPDLILLDDAYQHRYVKAGFNILLTTYSAPFYNDLILPAGNLRESRSGKNRANIIVVTKCPDDLSLAAAEEIKRKLKPIKGQSVYFSGLEYGAAVNHLGVEISSNKNSEGTLRYNPASSGITQGDSGSNRTKSIILLTGIANPATMLDQLKKQYTVVKHLHYPDHHNFTESDLKQIAELLKTHNIPIITTEKDWVRLKALLSQEVLEQVFYLPIQVKILLNGEQKLLKEVGEFVSAQAKSTI